MDKEKINHDRLKDIEEYKAKIDLYSAAKAYLEKYTWCKNIINCWCQENISIYDKIGVFLFEIEPISNTVDDFIWIIIGDLPTVYLDKSVKTGEEALSIYCDLMNEWADNVIEGNSTNECYPLEAEPTIDNAKLLKKRIAFIRKELLLITR